MSKSRFLAGKFNYSMLFRMKIKKKSSNFGAKIEICLKVNFCQNKILGQKLDFWYSVRQYIGKKISLAILNVLQSLFER